MDRRAGEVTLAGHEKRAEHHQMLDSLEDGNESRARLMREGSGHSYRLTAKVNT